MKPKEFRDELKKTMPGYKWTVHKQIDKRLLIATGIKSRGYNRMSTLEISRMKRKAKKIEGTPGDIEYIEYNAKSSGTGTKAPWLGECSGKTLKQALRSLQEYYEKWAIEYGSHAYELNSARKGQKNK